MTPILQLLLACHLSRITVTETRSELQAVFTICLLTQLIAQSMVLVLKSRSYSLELPVTSYLLLQTRKINLLSIHDSCRTTGSSIPSRRQTSMLQPRSHLADRRPSKKNSQLTPSVPRSKQ